MHYTVLSVGGKQVWGESGKFYDVNKISAESGKEIIFNRVLLFNNQGNILIGHPYLESVQIQAIILKHFKNNKTIVYKMRPKKKTRTKQGNREKFTRILIENISLKGR